MARTAIKLRPDQTVITIGFIVWMFDSEIRTTNNYNFDLGKQPTCNAIFDAETQNIIQSRTGGLGLTDDRGLA